MVRDVDPAVESCCRIARLPSCYSRDTGEKWHAACGTCHALQIFDKGAHTEASTHAFMKESIGHKLYEHRRAMGLNQREMARLLGSQRGARVSRYEQDRRLPPIEVLLTYMVIHQRPLSELLPDLYSKLSAEVLENLRGLLTELPDAQPMLYKVEVLKLLEHALNQATNQHHE